MGIQVLEDAIDKKRRELSEMGVVRQENFSPTKVKSPKPGKVYHAALDDPRRISELKSLGYTISQEEFNVGTRKPTGEFLYKDVVLMEIDQDTYVERHARYRASLDTQSESVRLNAREKVNKILRDENKQSSSVDHTFDESSAEEPKTKSKIFK